MTAYDAGTAFLQVVPSFKGWDAAVTRQVKLTSEQIEKGVAQALPEGFRQGSRSATAQGAKAGDDFGGAFGKAVRTRIDAALKALPKVELRADSSDADIKIAAVRAELEDLRSKRIGVDIDEGLALAQLARLQAELERLSHEDPTVSVRINSDLAAQELAAIQAEVNHLDGQTAHVHVKVDRDTSDLGGVGGLSGIGSGGIGLGGLLAGASPLAVPLAAAGAGGLAGVASVAGAGAAGLGVLGIGLSGVTKAVQDLAAANTAAGSSATAAGAAQIRATLAVAAAQRQLKSAEDGLAQARANAADAAISAQERVESALRAQAAAERNLSTAQQSQKDAQEALTEARKTAAEQLQDLNSQVTNGALSVRQGELDVTNARLALQNVNGDPLSTQQQRQQAQLDYETAQQRLKDLQTQQGRLGDAQKDAAAKGVEGSDVVVTAQKNLALATQAVTDAYTAQTLAEQGVNDARRAQATTLRNSAAAIAAAQNSILSAQAAVQSAALQSTTAGGALQQRVAAMSAPLKAFATFINGTVKPAFATLRTAIQNALLPDLQTGLTALLPILPALTTFAASLASTMGDLFIEASKALGSPFWQDFFAFIGRTAGPILDTLGHIIGNLITGFAGLLQAFGPITLGIGAGILNLTEKFADFATHLSGNSSFQAFLAYVRREGPAVVHFFGDLFRVVGRLFQALAPLGAMMLDLTNAVLDLVTALGPEGLLLAIGAIAVAVALLGGPVEAIVIAIVAFAGAIAYAYEHVKPFHDFIANTLVPTLRKMADNVLTGLKIGLDYITTAVKDNHKQLSQLGDILHRVTKFIVEHVLPVYGTQLKFVFEGIGLVIASVIYTIGTLIDTFNTVHDAVETFVGYVKDLPARITSVTRHLWDGLVSSFKSAINAIIRIWNDLGFHVKIPDSAFGIPIPGGGSNIGIDTPNIPLLRAAGGAVTGPGTWTSDSIPARLSTGEHVWPAREVAALGGQQAMYSLRRVLTGYASGGPVTMRPSTGAGLAAAGISGAGLARLNDIAGGGPRTLHYEQHLHYPVGDDVGHGQMRAQQLLLHDLSNR